MDQYDFGSLQTKLDVLHYTKLSGKTWTSYFVSW